MPVPLGDEAPELVGLCPGETKPSNASISTTLPGLCGFDNLGARAERATASEYGQADDKRLVV